MKPYAHQQRNLTECGLAPAWAWLDEMGLGKTAVDIWDSDRLFERGLISGWLIIAPMGIYRTWASEDKGLPKFAKSAHRIAVQNSSNLKADRIKVDAICAGPCDDRVLDVLIINVESLTTPKAKDVINSFFRSHRVGVKTSVDESTTIKNPAAKRTLAAWKIGRASKFRRILSGFPYPQSPLDAFAQFYFLDPDVLKYQNIFAFKAHYAQMRTMVLQPTIGTDGKRHAGRSIKVVDSYRNLDELQQRVGAVSCRNLKEDCLDLPPKVYEQRFVDLTGEQQEAYDDLRRYGIAELDQYEGTVTVAMKLTLNMRLQQICAGHVTLDEGKGVRRLKNNRIQAMIDFLSECSGKVVLWSHFVPSIQDMIAAIGKEFGEASVRGYYGATKDKDRPAIVEEFQDAASPLRFFVGNPRTGKTGLTLTASYTALYYTNSFDLEDRVQSEDRIHRIGQAASTLYVDFTSPGTVDEKVRHAMVVKKQTASQAMGEDWKEWLE